MNNEIEKVIASFEHSKSILNAMGDENRQIIILELMKKQKCTSCKGIRVNCLAKRTNLSRAAISRHLQILKNAKLVKVVKKGTMNYYYWNPDVEVLREITKLVQDVSIVAESTEEESI